LAYREARLARAEAMGEGGSGMRDAETRMADNGAPPATAFARAAQQLARMVDKEPGIQLAFLAFGGWDTHVNQGGTSGLLATSLRSLAEGLAALAQGLGAHYGDTAIIVMSEFGRRLKENVSGGTDHGRANALWLFGGPVQGGKVYGDWPGLTPDRLVEGLDLAVTTDFRAVAASVSARLFRVSDRDLAHVFPQGPTPSAGIAGLTSL